MILLKIDPQGITALPLKRDTPRTINVDAVALGQTMKTMEIEAWHL
jgi:hypothetical protein